MGLRRLTTLFLTLFLLATIATGVATYAVSRLTITRLVDQRIATISEVVAGDGDGRADDTPAILARIGKFARERDTGDIGFVLSDAQGQTLGGNITLGRPPGPGYSTLRRSDGIVGLSRGRALTRPLGGGRTLVIIAETDPFDHYDAARLRIFLGGFGSIIVIVFGGVVGFGVLVARRIATMRRTAEAIIAGDMSRRIPVRDAVDEFDRQALAFNRMLDRIGDLMTGLRHVSDDVAHDMRAPLGRLRNQLSAIAAAKHDPELLEQVDAAIMQCDELLGLFTAILRISEIEGGDRVAGFVAVDLSDLVKEIAAMMEPVATETGHHIGFVEVGVASVTIEGNRQLLTQALINLLENALAHTPEGTTITVCAGRRRGGAFVSVTDDGPGIPCDQYELALRRFGRLDKSRTSAGHGLGLPLVAAIARLHRGGLTLGDAGPGLVATFKIADPAR